MLRQLEELVDHRIRSLIGQSLADFRSQLQEVAYHGTHPPVKDERKQQKGIAGVLGEDYLNYTETWIADRIRDITELAAISLSCLADELAAGAFGGQGASRGARQKARPADCTQHPGSTVVFPGGNCAESSGDEHRTKAINHPGDDRSTKGVGKGMRLGGPLDRGAVVHFLNSHDFTRVKSGKEEVFEHGSGQRVSIPRAHGGQKEIKSGTAQKVKKRIIEILGQKVEIVSGSLAET